MAKKSWVSKAYWGFYIANFIVILIYLGISWWLYQQAPDRIPVHWNTAGKVDSYGNRIEIFIACLIPLIGVILHPRLVDRKYPESSGSNISTKAVCGDHGRFMGRKRNFAGDGLSVDRQPLDSR